MQLEFKLVRHPYHTIEQECQRYCTRHFLCVSKDLVGSSNNEALLYQGNDWSNKSILSHSSLPAVRSVKKLRNLLPWWDSEYQVSKKSYPYTPMDADLDPRTISSSRWSNSRWSIRWFISPTNDLLIMSGYVARPFETTTLTNQWPTFEIPSSHFTPNS